MALWTPRGVSVSDHPSFWLPRWVEARRREMEVAKPPVIKWELRSLDVKNALLPADGFDRDVFIQAPAESELTCGDRVWRLRAPVYSLTDAPEAFRRSLKRRILNSDASTKRAGLRCHASTSDPCLFYFSREETRSGRVYDANSR